MIETDILGVGGDGIAGLTPELRLVLTLAMVKYRSVGNLDVART